MKTTLEVYKNFKIYCINVNKYPWCAFSNIDNKFLFNVDESFYAMFETKEDLLDAINGAIPCVKLDRIGAFKTLSKKELVMLNE